MLLIFHTEMQILEIFIFRIQAFLFKKYTEHCFWTYRFHIYDGTLVIKQIVEKETNLEQTSKILIMRHHHNSRHKLQGQMMLTLLSEMHKKIQQRINDFRNRQVKPHLVLTLLMMAGQRHALS